MLRDGTVTAYAPRAEIDLEWIVRKMVGKDFDLGSPPEGYAFGGPTLSIKGLAVPSHSGASLAVDHMELEVKAGEIVCI